MQQQVKRYAREIVPSFNAYIYYRLGYWLAKSVSRFIYRVRVAAADVKALQNVDPNATVVFVMNHRSNMDYVLISYLASEQVTLSYAVGEWARVFPLEALIRAMGAFFVRRGSQNPLYRKVLERYVAMATERGVCQAVFLEGGLSRDGNLNEPKLGFLDYILRNYDWQQSRNIIFIPIGINYDTVLEDSNLINWDNKKARPSTWQHLKRFSKFLRENLFINSRTRWKKHGYASANFGIPVSMQDYCRERQIEFNHLPKDERFQQVDRLARQLMDALRFVMPVLPVPVLCTVLLQFQTKPQTAIDLLAESDNLMDYIIAKGAAMKVEQKPRPKTLVDSLEMLVNRGLVVVEGEFYRANPEKLSLLSYYANSIGHWWPKEQVASDRSEHSESIRV
jgi:glycerol-3-phosphate O-acyltransferase